MSVRRQRNYVPGEHDGDFEPKSALPSMTVPDMTLTVRDIIERHTRGFDLSGLEREPFYTDEFIPNYHAMDPTEVQDFAEQNAERIRETINSEIRNENSKKIYAAKRAIKKDDNSKGSNEGLSN